MNKKIAGVGNDYNPDVYGCHEDGAARVKKKAVHCDFATCVLREARPEGILFSLCPYRCPAMLGENECCLETYYLGFDSEERMYLDLGGELLQTN